MRTTISWSATALAFAALVSACTPGERSKRPEVPLSAPATRTVVLVAIDGVRWHEVFEGVDPALADRYGLTRSERLDAESLTPNLHRLMTREGAAIGAPGEGPEMVASGPNFMSLPGYI